jgi:transcriptional regulator with XRE-family HTH domain
MRGRLTRHLTLGLDEVETESLLRVFGENLRSLRSNAGLSQQTLGDRCFLRHDQISQFERGLAEPSLPVLLILADGLGVSVEKLTERLQAPRRRASSAKMLTLLAERPELKTDELAQLLDLPSWYVLQNGREEVHDVDPAILLTTRQAEVLAAALRRGPEEVETLALSGLIGDFTLEIAELVVQLTPGLMKGMAYGFETCVGAIHSASGAEARCRLYIGDEELGEGGKKITLYWGVETCWGERHDLAGKVFWTFKKYCSGA